MSDATHLSNYAGDKKEWPIYMTIGNTSSKIRQTPSMYAVVLVALLPIPPKKCYRSKQRLADQCNTHRNILQEVLRNILEPLTFQPNSTYAVQNSMSSSGRQSNVNISLDGYYNILCADGQYRHCKSVLAAWQADSPEYNDLHNLERGVCYWCECPKSQLGDYIGPGKDHP
jgi:hypothetical protein